MGDIIVLVGLLAFGFLSWALLILCDRLMGERK
jgi:hypothetical protein